ncbi:hypothetical protein CHARACLAT_013019 [Characodon lateralis]|uniref:Uncharacterized protein n=1 Tax=Characodon lateralis TaxID=208331 RepID=A0ABU7D681_9TELE|nr:hypothetical protein [Characodon lateralis]
MQHRSLGSGLELGTAEASSVGRTLYRYATSHAFSSFICNQTRQLARYTGSRQEMQNHQLLWRLPAFLGSRGGGAQSILLFFKEPEKNVDMNLNLKGMSCI